MDQIIVNGLAFRPYLDAATIAQRVGTLGANIRRDYAGKDPLFLAVLNGAFIFAADLVRAAQLPCEISFVKLASYEGTASTGELTIHLGINTPLAGRHVIIVEDIIDTGRTLVEFKATVLAQQPASVAIAALLLKPEALQVPLQAEYVGFEIPTRFVIGYGLDYDQWGRELPAIYQLADAES